MKAPWDKSDGYPYVIAEIGVNHNGDRKIALKLMDAAVRAGADAVKFQTFQTNLVASTGASAAPYQQERASASTQMDLLRKYEFTEDDWRALASRAHALGIGFMSTAFDLPSLQLVESLNPIAHKIPSGEITNLRFLAEVAALRRPSIISTGMSSVDEISSALAFFDREVGVALFHCVSAYPTPIADANLLSIPFLSATFNCTVGWSDHTESPTCAELSVALGARLFERHITLDHDMAGPDHRASAEPEEFADYVARIRQAVDALGTYDKKPRPSELTNLPHARRSWHATRDLRAGDVLSPADIAALRPAHGVPVNIDLAGRRLLKAVTAGIDIKFDDLEPDSRSHESQDDVS